MKQLLIFVITFAAHTIFGQGYSDSIQKLRDAHQINFPKEVLNDSERSTFNSICYFPIDTNLIVAATFKRIKGKRFKMPMTIERTVYYRKYGELTFKINDSVCVLNVYENLSLKGIKEYKNYLFLPFKDASSGKETYGAGRYLDVQKQPTGIYIIDFNLAYHPYCAYSNRYSCPIVPAENTLPVPVLAGECYVTHV